MSGRVSLVPCRSYDSEPLEAAISEAIDSVNGLEALKPGMKVGIKANLVAGMAPDTAVTTHPAALAALVRILLRRGAEQVTVGDSPGGLYTPAFVNHVYRAAGLEAVVAAGAILNDDFSQVAGHSEEAKAARSFTYTGWIDKCDLLINFCKLKSHGMMGMSAAVKNLFGIIPGTMKPEYHFRFPDPAVFADMIVDIAEFAAPVLSVCDAVVAMEGNGPTQGTPRPLGLISASRDMHALDLVSASIIGLSPDTVPTLAAAAKRGLVPTDIRELTILGNPADYRLADFKTLAVRHGLLFSGNDHWYGRMFSRVARRALASRPVPKKSCIGCSKCRDICPAKAITMKERRPVIDRSVCIRCFCCQEFCPVGAMRVHRTLVARILTK